MGAMPSIVVISAPPTSFMGVVQERMAAPFWCTVHAPHNAMPQPNFVPVSSATSRKYQSNGMSGSPPNVFSFPFTLKRIICPPVNRGCCKIDFHILVAEREMWKSEATPASVPVRPSYNRLSFHHPLLREEFWPTTICGTGSKHST